MFRANFGANDEEADWKAIMKKVQQLQIITQNFPVYTHNIRSQQVANDIFKLVNPPLKLTVFKSAQKHSPSHQNARTSLKQS